MLLSFPLSLKNTRAHTHTHSFSSVTVACYILYPYLHRKHVSKEGQRASTEWFAYAALQSDREPTSPLIHSLSKARTQTHDPVRKRTLRAWYWESCLCFLFLHSPQVCDAKCEAAGSRGGDTSVMGLEGWFWTLRNKASACVCYAGRPFFLLCRQSFHLKELKHSSYGFYVLSLPSSGRAFIPSWRRRRGSPEEFYKCPSGGTAGTSLFPSTRKRSSERRQSSAWWESWRSFWSALGCDSRCWSGMKRKDRNEGVWAKSKRC